MFFTNLFNYLFWAEIIEFVGALVIIGYIVAALIALIRRLDIHQARLLVIDGVINSLSFKVAGSLLKTIELRTWQQILMFVAIAALRIILKRVFVWERAELANQIIPQPPDAPLE
ncbi:DUF1622 domain-containing protein [Tengunoibacter tsumagoiensis]|nr:DUF1622 domain-containing protein [Tengunoibacter tsumagoiensis]